MYINLFSILFIIILGVFLSGNDSKNNRRLYIILCSIVLIFIAAMRSPEWTANNYGIDTLSYKDFFESSFDMGWNELWSLAYMRYFGNIDEGDIGFTCLVKLIGFFTHDFAIYSLIVDLLFFIPFGIILYHYCSRMVQIIFAFIFYISLLQVFFLGGGRQMFAIGFDLMALLAVFNKRKVYAVLFALLAVTIHFSALLFAIPLILIWTNVKASPLKVAHFLCLLLFPLVYAFPNQLIVFMGESVGMEKYADYGKNAIAGGTDTFIYLIAMLSIFCYIAIKKKHLLQNSILCKFYVMAPLMTVFAPLIRSNGTMIRISLYYHLFLALLVPFAIDCMFVKGSRTVVYVMAIGVLVLLTLLNSSTLYYFYWQV